MQPSLNINETKKYDPRTPKDSEKGKEELISNIAKPFTFEDVQKAWFKFLNIDEKENKTSVIILLKNRLIELDNNTIWIKLENLIQESKLNEFKDDLMFFIRNELQNSAIYLKTSIIEEENLQKSFKTDKEKFNDLAAKNPVLLDLKELLGLDIDL